VSFCQSLDDADYKMQQFVQKLQSILLLAVKTLFSQTARGIESIDLEGIGLILLVREAPQIPNHP